MLLGELSFLTLHEKHGRHIKKKVNRWHLRNEKSAECKQSGSAPIGSEVMQRTIANRDTLISIGHTWNAPEDQNVNACMAFHGTFPPVPLTRNITCSQETWMQTGVPFHSDHFVISAFHCRSEITHIFQFRPMVVLIKPSREQWISPSREAPV